MSKGLPNKLAPVLAPKRVPAGVDEELPNYGVKVELAATPNKLVDLLRGCISGGTPNRVGVSRGKSL